MTLWLTIPRALRAAHPLTSEYPFERTCACWESDQSATPMYGDPMYRDLAERAQVFSDRSVLQDGSAAATCIAPQLETE
ncbi:hypothetical protein MRX96_004351 [Rhipicephalus microplus]